MRTADCGIRNSEEQMGDDSDLVPGIEYSVLPTKHYEPSALHPTPDRARQGQRGSNLGGRLSDGRLDETQSKANAAGCAALPGSR